MRILLVQGVFFQKQSWAGVGYTGGEGAVAVMRSGLLNFVFSGVLQLREDIEGAFIGQVSDTFGTAAVIDGAFKDDSFWFQKLYDKYQGNTSYAIFYELRRSGEEWVGTYEASHVGKGAVRCFIREVADEFFDPGKAAELAGLREAHTWAKKRQK